MPREMDLYNNVWDFGVVGLPSPTHSENGLDFSSPSIQASFDGFDELNAYNEKSDALAAEWMDKTIDLSILEDMESQPDILNDLEAMVGDPVALLDNLMDWSSEFLGNESDTANAKPEKGTSFEQDILQIIGPSPPASPSDKVPDIGFAALPELTQESLYRQTFGTLPMNINSVSPDVKSNVIDYDVSEYLKVELNSPADTDIDSCTASTPPLTPLSFVPSVECISAEDNTGVKDNTSVQVAIPHSSFVLDSSFSSKNSDNESNEESDLSVKGHNSDNTPSLVFKAVAESHLQVKRGRSSKKSVSPRNIQMPVEVKRKERKRVQNKDAATRYRQKRRKETQAVVEEELALETRNKELTNKVEALSNEISYLKGLLKEAKLRAQAKQKSIL